MPGHIPDKRIDEEIVCVDALVHCLKEHCGCAEVTAEREKDDPPDFWVTIDGDRYAAEVTSIVTKEEYHAAYKKFEQTVRECAREQDLLSGTYVLTAKRYPRLPKIQSLEWNSLLDRIVGFIAESRGAESTAEHHFLQDGRRCLSVQKLSAEGVGVRMCVVSSPQWEGETQDELRQLMTDAVTKKHAKLENVAAKCTRIILLFYNAYGFGDVEDAQKALLEAEGHEWFHSVFWAGSFTNRKNELAPGEPGRVSVFLYSKNKDWWTRP